jgi:hypothetical protein
VAFSLRLEKASALAATFSQAVVGFSMGFEPSSLAFEASSLVMESLAKASERLSIPISILSNTAK